MVTATVAFISLVLMIAGLALKNVLLLLASSISWLIFAFLMYDYDFTNTAIHTGLLMFGGAMTIISAVMALNVFMSGKPKEVNSEDDYESYKKKVMDATRRH